MTPVEMVASSSVLVVALGALYARRPSYKDIVDRLAKVEGRVDDLEEALHDERRSHARTFDRLLAALRFIREFMTWRGGPRVVEPPQPAADLLRELA